MPNFVNLFQKIDLITGKDPRTVNLKEFIGHFIIFYKETGGKFYPITERGSDAYFFESRTLLDKQGKLRRKEKRVIISLLTEEQVTC